MDKLPLWSTVERFYLDSERTIQINGTPKFQVHFRKNPSSMTFIIESDSDIGDSFSKLKNINIYVCDNPSGIAISCSDDCLFEFFYMSATSIVNAVRNEFVPVPKAIRLALENLGNLIEKENEKDMSAVVTGLWGELYVLESLINLHGVKSVNYWLGPENEAHDFRCSDFEMEVKTTKSERRLHIVGSFTQLQPSEGKKLYLCSVCIVPTQGGRSLLELRESVDELLKNNESESNRFDYLLKSKDFAFGSDPSSIKYDLRFPTLVFPVNDGFPKVTRLELNSLFKSNASSIIEGSYSIELSDYFENIKLNSFINNNFI
ncbi:PD-(D/E)XK motif protein [Pleionea mediterranea]|uniref:Putative PD-(D/E)XK family protein DUF4420 n=1 Tax=Pleionea mediterranea TaxID=523701 RepID=A0A316FJG9_9GAMM|nr:PD-(D/E)XK motif protein [Pleionea mediterranea]PWK47910.1 putative PD-(D/E)XK family protein DUF4420 [Pleionea mediterranea]